MDELIQLAYLIEYKRQLDIPALLTQNRIALGLSMADVGRMVGVSRATIQRVEKGLLGPSDEHILALARAVIAQRLPG